jgi:hypothetical protein
LQQQSEGTFFLFCSLVSRRLTGVRKTNTKPSGMWRKLRLFERRHRFDDHRSEYEPAPSADLFDRSIKRIQPSQAKSHWLSVLRIGEPRSVSQ